jgi:hypothetical protein
MTFNGITIDWNLAYTVAAGCIIANLVMRIWGFVAASLGEAPKTK